MKKSGVLSLAVLIAGCSTLPSMGSASNYATYSCDQLAREVNVIQQHEDANREAGSIGFMDFFIAALGGVAAGIAQDKGNYAQSQQIIQNVGQRDSQRATYAATADTLSERATLLGKLRQAKGCS